MVDKCDYIFSVNDELHIFGVEKPSLMYEMEYLQSITRAQLRTIQNFPFPLYFRVSPNKLDKSRHKICVSVSREIKILKQITLHLQPWLCCQSGHV